jgi:hypothetical protein
VNAPALVPCGCGGLEVDVEGDPRTASVLIECLHCGRIAGGLSRLDATSMWNAAMAEPANLRQNAN